MIRERIRSRVLDNHNAEYIRRGSDSAVILSGHGEYKLTLPDGTSYRRELDEDPSTHVYVYDELEGEGGISSEVFGDGSIAATFKDPSELEYNTP